MNIMSFNTQHCQNYLTKEIDFALMAKTITDLGADIVGLNEMRGGGVHPEYADQVKRLSELTGMRYYYFATAFDIPNKGLYGNAILSKLPIIEVETISVPVPEVKKYKGYYEPRCVLRAVLEGGMTVLISHFGLNPDEVECAVQAVSGCLADKKCILMGDFNVEPEDDVLNPIRARMRDTADFFETPLLSFPSDAPDRKIDYLFVSRDVEVLSADIPPIVASDHRPYVATVRL